MRARSDAVGLSHRSPTETIPVLAFARGRMTVIFVGALGAAESALGFAITGGVATRGVTPLPPTGTATGVPGDVTGFAIVTAVETTATCPALSVMTLQTS